MRLADDVGVNSNAGCCDGPGHPFRFRRREVGRVSWGGARSFAPFDGGAATAGDERGGSHRRRLRSVLRGWARFGPARHSFSCVRANEDHNVR